MTGPPDGSGRVPRGLGTGQRPSPSTLASIGRTPGCTSIPTSARSRPPVSPARRWTPGCGGIRAGRRTGRPLRADGAPRLHDPAVGPGRCGRGGAAPGRCDRPVHRAEPDGGAPSGAAGMDRTGAHLVLRLRRHPGSGPGPGLAAAGGPREAPRCGAGPAPAGRRPGRRPARGPPQRRRRRGQGRRRAPGRGPDQDGPVPGRRPGRGHRRHAACLPGGAWAAGAGPRA